jgi:hypothetical protein
MKLRSGVVFVCALLVGALLVPGALAQKPERFPSESGPPLELAAGEVCPFPVLLETVENKAVVTIFPSGRVLVTGKYATRVTNLASGESIIVKNSGPLTFTPLPNGNTLVVGRGVGLFYLLAGKEPGGPGLFVSKGRLVAEIDPEAFLFVTPVEVRGKTIDLCARLASP